MIKKELENLNCWRVSAPTDPPFLLGGFAPLDSPFFFGSDRFGSVRIGSAQIVLYLGHIKTCTENKMTPKML